MAIQWLDLAMSYNWAPSFLLAARLYLTKKIYSDLAAPTDAIQLSEKRYPYTSGAKYEKDRSARARREPPEVPMVDNPLYDPGKAKRLLREIFYAGRALEARMSYNIKRRNTSNSARVSFASIRSEMRRDEAKWFDHPTFYPLFMDVERGVLHDRDHKIDDLLTEAKKHCKQERWYIYAQHDGGLLYDWRNG